MLLENKQREAEDLAFSINLLETETKYRIQVAEKEKERDGHKKNISVQKARRERERDGHLHSYYSSLRGWRDGRIHSSYSSLMGGEMATYILTILL